MYYCKNGKGPSYKADTIAVTCKDKSINHDNTVGKYNPKGFVLFIHSVESKVSVL